MKFVYFIAYKLFHAMWVLKWGECVYKNEFVCSISFLYLREMEVDVRVKMTRNVDINKDIWSL